MITRPDILPQEYSSVNLLFSGQEEAMMGQLVERGPLAAVVDAVSWQDYLGGIIQHHCSSQRSNHAVLIVGYDTTGTHCNHTDMRRNCGSRKKGI